MSFINTTNINNDLELETPERESLANDTMAWIDQQLSIQTYDMHSSMRALYEGKSDELNYNPVDFKSSQILNSIIQEGGDVIDMEVDSN
jgi:hypothetical protein